MTRERRLAVQMWREIAECIRNGCVINFGEIVAYKARFCKDYMIDWGNWDCWLCKYCKSCSCCPLYKYSGGYCQNIMNPYKKLEYRDTCHKLISYDGSEEEFAGYADFIADILEGNRRLK